MFIRGVEYLDLPTAVGTTAINSTKFTTTIKNNTKSTERNRYRTYLL